MSDSLDFSLGSVEVALTPIERFQEFLDSRGKRITSQRRLLVETVFSRHEHFEADELVEELAYKSKQRVSRPTIYRTLSELVDAGLLRKISLPTGRLVYEHDYGYPQHDHLYCQKCNHLIEFQSDELVQLRDAVAKQHQFQVTGHRFIIQGICTDCRTRRRKRPVDLV